MSDYEHAVFISYAWGGEREEIVNQMDKALQARGIKIIRDKRNLGYKGSISEFMERIGRGNCVIVVISDKYLRSPNCMFELVEIAKNKDFYDRVFPVVLSDADIYNPVNRIKYIKHWEDKLKELDEAMKSVSSANLQGIREEIDSYDEIRDRISGLTFTLKDMNTLTPEMHQDSNFSEIYDGIERRMKEKPGNDTDAAPAPVQDASKPADQARSGGNPNPTPPPPSQSINFGGSAQFSGPVQFGNSQNVQNIYYNNVAPEQTQSPDLRETIDIEGYEPETLLIPEGFFSLGSEPREGIPDHEAKRHEVFLPNYRIGKYPVTNAQYEQFIQETGRIVKPVMGWEGQRVPRGLEQHPVTGVTWYEALAYSQWLKEKTGREYSLPNEAQWEKACRGGNYSFYPWGDDFDSTRSNQGCATLAAVDAYPAQNDYGCFDLVGNVRQWTCTLWGEKRIAPDSAFGYPWKDDLRRNDLRANSQIRRVVRGSSFSDDPNLLRCSVRTGQLPEDAGFPGARHGFRVVMLIPSNQR